MCGIFGWIDPRLEVAQADHLIEALKHRGPDDAGWVGMKYGENRWHSQQDNIDATSKCEAVIGQTRLSIIDLSNKGHQPMQSQDGHLQMVFNGEVYNYKELRGELKQLGYSFYSDSDTEVVLNALVAWGEQALERFIGMFSIALLDKKNRRLTLIRDPFGIKPLLYSQCGEHFYFASELPALLQFSSISRDISWQVAADYIFQGCYEQGQQSFLKAVTYLPPAHLLHIDLQPHSCKVKQTHLKRYWTPNPDHTITISKSEAIEQLQAKLEQSIRLHLRSDVPVGCALSGGLDSSIITCLVRKLYPETPLHTFSFIAKGSPVNEQPWVNAVVNHTNVIGHNIVIEPAEILHDMDDFILSQGEPHGGYSIYAQYRIFKSARAHGIKVMLEGQGADESWAGYWGYPEFRLQSLLRQGKFLQIIPFLKAINQYPDRSAMAVIQRLLQQYLIRLPNTWWIRARNLSSQKITYPWIDQEAMTQYKVNFQWLYPTLFKGKNCMKNRMATELSAQKMVALLRHSDRAAMRFSVESRVPFLTLPLVEFALSLPESFLLNEQAEPKHLLKEATGSLLPEMILKRRDKNGFHTPNDWYEALLPWFTEQNQAIDTIPMIDKRKFLSAYSKVPASLKLRIATFIRWYQLLRPLP